MRKIVPMALEFGRYKSNDGYGTTYHAGLNGMFHVQGPTGEQLRIVASTAELKLAQGWEHVSVSTATRTPTWEEMAFVKRLFWTEEECVVQFHPPEAQHVNNHPHCLHLWRNINEMVKLPPEFMVGIKAQGQLKDGAHAARVREALDNSDCCRQYANGLPFCEDCPAALAK